MPKPVLLAQLSDLHLGASWEGIDPLPRLERVVEAIGSLPNELDAVLVSGDLTDDGGAGHYRLARERLEPLGVPVHVLPGNHDDRVKLRAAFDLPGGGGEPVDYATEVGDLRLLVVDSTVPGEDAGAFDPEQLSWLDAELSKEPERPTLLAMHHPPLATGIPDWDAVNLLKAERDALAEVVARHPQLRAIVGGHLHRVAASTLAGCPILSVPSTYLQALPDFEVEDFENEDIGLVGPPGFALHVLLDGQLSSQVESLAA
ncbi:MAG TPA: phosphodiesterase [Solirubrobacterales bacterium]|jgi:3',5'-cyclic AMP phosphodiesterase CpdA|nr:phosphodiesterase [Solirubrobacterales bacterium]